jgi:hypothetical protein
MHGFSNASVSIASAWSLRMNNFIHNSSDERPFGNSSPDYKRPYLKIWNVLAVHELC